MYKTWWKIVFLISLICPQWAYCLSPAHCRLSFNCSCNISYPPVTYAQLESTLTYLLTMPFDYYPVLLVPQCQPAMPLHRPALEKKGCSSTSTCLRFMLELSAVELRHCTAAHFTRYSNIRYNSLLALFQMLYSATMCTMCSLQS